MMVRFTGAFSERGSEDYKTELSFNARSLLVHADFKRLEPSEVSQYVLTVDFPLCFLG